MFSLCRKTVVAVGLLIASLSAAPGVAFAATGERVALVIGNSAYRHVNPLPNPQNDASDIGRELEALGFDVEVGIDLGRRDMWQAIRRFARAIDDAEAALFYYAGHGIQKDQENYLIPVDAELETELDLPAFAVSLSQFLSPLENSERANLVFLDACRDNPLDDQATTRGLGANDGLAPVQGTGGMLVAYATDPNQVAEDGRGRNSPFTGALLRHMDEPGLEIREMMVRVREEVLSETNRAQRPWVEDGLDRRFYFNPSAAKPITAAPAGPGPTVADRPDFVMWMAVQNSKRASDLELFLNLFPDTPLAPLARNRLAALRPDAGGPNAQQASPPRPAPSTPRPPEQTEPSWSIQPIEGERVVIADHGANLRSGPGPEHERIGYLRRDQRVTVTGRTAGGTWYRVKTDAHDNAYVYAPLLASVTQTARLREPPVPVTKPAVPEASSSVSANLPPRRKPGEIFRDCPECPKLVAVPPGRYDRGSPAGEAGRAPDEGPVRNVRIRRPLAIGLTEVTFGEWEACVAGGGCAGYVPHDEGWGRGDLPVINVSFNHAKIYARWLRRRTGKDYRLLSEAEWEYAARAGSGSSDPWAGRDDRACALANTHDATSRSVNSFRWPGADCSDGFAATAPVGSFSPNAFGLHDMIGNVWEWTADCYASDYGQVPTDGKAFSPSTCERRVLRGGGWRDRLSRVRYAARAAAPSSSQTSLDGFRIARVLDEGLDQGPGSETTVSGGRD
ncbi:MAG: SUMF1/EgtB/PvdO family nonheme iron enzyme [Geminicoccaceae bacterium]